MRSALLKEMAWGKEYAGTIFLTLLTSVLTSQPLAAGIRSPIFASIRYWMSVSGSTSWTFCPNMFRYTSARAPESLNW
ncbi:hypothetical protein D3C73_1174650 [compost metagenome]